MITLKTLLKATAQEVFDQVAVHLLTQNKKSYDNTQNCTYKGKNGLSCAAGCLIGDGEYKELFEYKSWQALTNSYGLPREHYQLIGKLQLIHDHHDILDWKQSLVDLADRNELNTNHKIFGEVK